MTLRKALEESPVGAARRPYLSGEIMSVVLIGQTQDVYVAFNSNGEVAKELGEDEKHQVVGRDDWEPVGRVLTTSGEVPKA